MCRICASLALFLDQPSEVMGLSTSLSGCSTPHGEIRETGQGCGDHGFGKLETTDPQSETATSICQAERCHPNPPPLSPPPNTCCACKSWIGYSVSFAERSRGKGADSGSRHRIRETPPTCHRIRLWLQKETRKKTRRGVTRDPLLVP